jgi:hypothetical protein
VNGYKSQFCASRNFLHQSGELRFNYPAWHCARPRQMTLNGGLSFLSFLRRARQNENFASFSLQRCIIQTLAQPFHCSRRDDIVCAEIGAQNRPICRGSKNAPCGCMVCFALALLRCYAGALISFSHYKHPHCAQ